MEVDFLFEVLSSLKTNKTKNDIVVMDLVMDCVSPMLFINDVLINV